MKKTNDPHPVHIVLRDHSKDARKANHVVAEKVERKETKNGDN